MNDKKCALIIVITVFLTIGLCLSLFSNALKSASEDNSSCQVYIGWQRWCLSKNNLTLIRPEHSTWECIEGELPEWYK